MIDANRVNELLARFEEPRGFPHPRQIGEAEIDSLENRIGIRVPDDLRRWFKISNGAFVGTVPVYGVHPFSSPLSMERRLEIYPEWREKSWIPISDDGCGNYYVLPTRGEFGDGFPVVFVEAVVDPREPGYVLASDLGHFLIFLMESELALMNSDPTELVRSPWPFDELKVVRDDPAILNFFDLRLPWDWE